MDKRIDDMPHGTGILTTEFEQDYEKKQRIPGITLRLWLSATKRCKRGKVEYALNAKEREEIARWLIPACHPKKPARYLDEPWEIVIYDHMRELTPEIRLRAWPAYKVPFDGERLLIMHDMTWMQPYHTAPASALYEGETIIAETEAELKNRNFIYDIRLFIHWPKKERKTYSFEEALAALETIKEQWKNLSPKKHEIGVLLGHNGQSAWEYKNYPISDFPQAFIADIRSDEKQRKGLDAIELQPLELYEHYVHHSEDYQIVAKYYGMECEEGYKTKRKPVGDRVVLELNNE